MTLLPYLRAPLFVDEKEVRFQRKQLPVDDPLDRTLLEMVFEGGADIDDLAAEVVRFDRASGIDEARSLLLDRFSEEDSIIGLAEVQLEESYDVILVEQGYGGVYVHTVEVAKRLQEKYRCLLISPVEPLFEDTSLTSVISLSGLREQCPELTYFSYIHLVRTIVRRSQCKLLLVAHRSQSLYLFDLIRNQPTIIFCDGFFDGTFRLSLDLGLPSGPRVRRRILGEIYYLVNNGSPTFFGITGTPMQNHYLLMAGYISLRDARENWCWGKRQTDGFKQAFPKLRRPIRFVPPFTDPDLYRPQSVDRRRVVLFTTTMHNIDKKGFPELVEAMQRLPDVRVRCVVRQPECLPKYPDQLEKQFEMGALPKEQMVRLYHEVWVNCRTSREESSPVSILESMICAVPQIVSPVVAEQIPLIEDGATGFVVDPDDTRGLVRALRTILGDREMRDRMGAEARRRACEYSFGEREKLFDRFLT